jgi:hypothetical protein
LRTTITEPELRACADVEGRIAADVQLVVPLASNRPRRGASDVDRHRRCRRCLLGLRPDRQTHTVGRLILPAQLDVVLALIIDAVHDDRRTDRRRAVECLLVQEH